MKKYERKSFGISYSLYTFNESESNVLQSNLITIFSPTFNNTGTLDSYFAGINIQETKYPIEVLIIDDASTVDYFEQLKKSAAKCRFHVKILRLHQNHYKKSEKHLLASQYVNGDYIAFCDPSDFWICPLKLDLQLDQIKKSASSWSVTKAEQYNLSNKQKDIMLDKLSPDFCTEYISNGLLNLAWGAVPFCAMMISKSSYNKVIKYLENRPIITALDHLFLMSAVSEGSCAFIEKVTACYRVGAPNSFSKKNILNHDKKMEFFAAHADSLSQFLLHLNIAELYPPTVKYISWMISQYLPVINEKALNSAVDTILKENSSWDEETHYLIFGSGFYSRMLSKNATFSRLPSNTFESLELMSDILLDKTNEIMRGSGKKILVFVTVFDPPRNLEISIEEYFSSLDDIKIINFPNQLLRHLVKLGALKSMKNIVEKFPLRCDVEIPTTGSLS